MSELQQIFTKFDNIWHTRQPRRQHYIRYTQFSPHLICVSALPCKMQMLQIVTFHSDYQYQTAHLFTCESSQTALAHLSHSNSVRPSVCPSVTGVDQSKMVQAKMTKSSLLTAWKILVSGTVKRFHKFERGHPKRRR